MNRVRFNFHLLDFPSRVTHVLDRRRDRCFQRIRFAVKVDGKHAVADTRRAIVATTLKQLSLLARLPQFVKERP